MKAILRVLVLVMPTLANGQFIISSGATMTLSPDATMAISTSGITIASTSQLSIAGTGRPNIVVSNSSSLVNNNASFDFSAVDLQVDLNGGSQIVTGNFVVKDLRLSSPGPKTVSGNLTITNSLTFVQGILTPSSGKILYTGGPNGLSGASNDSYVEGPFYNGGPDDNKKFPIGLNNTFAGAFLVKASGEVGMQVSTGPAGFNIAGDPELLDLNTDRYWEILTDITQAKSPVGLSTNGLDAFTANSALAVVQSDAIGGTATNLSSAKSDPAYVVSRVPVTAPFLAIGKEANIKVVIHDLITPFTVDTQNDFLYIEHIEHFEYNMVTLLDRWGVEVKKWANFTNYNDPVTPNADGYDFAKLSPGNYICIVEYGMIGGKTEKISQMVTVLKTN